ncbi:MAG TPA: flagellar basal-body rod protein FlgF [Candidatus Acidoferrales bacterium]|nr:flagellar basal-body rod protein FlgF [Candidatus Acidoferrales bacterium]
MIKGIYTSALGLLPLQKKLEVIANNLANVNTTAFKRDDAFANELISAKTLLHNGTTDPVEKDVDEQTTTDFSQGTLRETGNTLDVAIDGQGFFAVETNDGVKLTRDGSFTISTDGTLVTRNGDAVMGTGGSIKIDDIQDLQKSQLVIERDGVVKAGNKIYGQIQIVSPENLNQLSKSGENSYTFKTDSALKQIDPSAYTVRQGFLEGSNVNPIDEMVAMIQIQQNFEAGQKAIQSQDTSLGQSNDVGKI